VRAKQSWIRAGVVVFAVLAALGVRAQTSQISSGLPSESFLGESFCFTTNFTNAGAPGFGPYIRLDLAPGLNFDSASIFGTTGGVANVGVFPAAPGNQLTDPRINQPVTGDPGNALIIMTFPVGSVVDGGPDLPIEICLSIDPSAEVGVPLPVNMTPVYQFGDTATGDNGPIIGGVVNQTVTPTVLLFEKTDSAPESERPPGTSWPYDYSLTVDIANTATINPLVIRDVLPADFQFQAGSIAISGGTGCSVTQTPPSPGPGGMLEVTCVGATVGTTSASDVEVVYSGYIIDVLDENFCDIQPQINDASAQGTYVPPVGPVQVLPPATDQTTVSAEHVVVQKSVAPGQASPGAALTYTLNFQVTDFGDVTNLVVTDSMPDGIDFISHGTLNVAGTPVAITPSVTVNPDFTKTIVYDIGVAAAPVVGTIAAGSAISLNYNAQVRQDFQNTGLPVLSSDRLPNTVDMNYDLVQGAAACSNGSAAAVTIIPVSLDKQIINLQPFYVPGEQVQFRLTMNVPAGDTRSIRFEDFLPLPVFEVADLDLSFGAADIVRGPDDTAGLNPTAITISVPQNALFIDWPDLDSTTPEIIQVDVFATVTDDPFADGLFLTNILLGSTNNTPGATAIATGPVSFNVGAPEMSITKGVGATDGNGLIAPSPANLPIDGDLTNADAGDQISYVITAENLGRAPAFDVTITDPGAVELTGCSVASVTDGAGTPLGFSGTLAGGLVLDDPLAANDGTPGAPFGADTTLVTVNCAVAATVAPDSSFSNTASLSWASQPGAVAFPALTDDANVSVRNVGLQKIFVASSEPGTSDAVSPPRVTIGEIVRYRLALRVPEGRIQALSLRDNLPNGLIFLNDGSARVAFVSNGAGLSSSSLALPNVNGNASSLAAIPSASLGFALPIGAISGGPFNSGTDPVFAFGDVINSDDDGDDEFLLAEFNALVANNGTNNLGNNRNNNFSALSAGTNLDGNSNTVQVRVAEPSVSVTKNASPTTGDAGDVISFTLVAANAGGANSSPAHETSLVDTLPPGLVNLRNVNISANAACTGLVTSDNTVGDTLDLLFSVLQPGCAVTVTFDADLTAAVAPGSVITNTANSVWTSLPGVGGSAANPTGSATPGAPGSATGERDGSGGVNDYTAAGSANVNVPGVGLVKTVTATSETGTGSAEFRPTIDDLAIGESATFEIVATLPEGTTPQLVVTDTVPFSNGVMRLDSASVVSIGANLTPDNLAPLAAISDAQLADGINDTVSFDFGQVINAPDGVVDAADRVVIQVTATLVDQTANANGDALANTALVQFGPGLNASASAGVDVVEPVLNIDKSGSITQGDAGDAVTFTITINHLPASAADAHDLVFQDTLPAGLILNPASISVVSGPNFDVNTSAGNTVALGWIGLLQTDTIVLEYQATMAPGVMPGQTITNTGDLSWTSIAGANADERSSSDSDAHAIVITEPGLNKIVFDTSEASTGAGEFGLPTDLTIGEQVTYRFTVEFPEGTSEAATVTDQLPTGSSMLQVVSSSVVRVGANLSGAGLPGPGASGVASDSNADSVDDRVEWTLGDIFNVADGIMNAADEIEFEVVAVVLDVAANQSGNVDQLNVATLQTSSSTVSGTAAVDLVAPALTLNKSIVAPADGFVDAGDSITTRLEISHVAASTADAFNLIVTDTLPAELNWAGDGLVTSDCPGLNIDSSGAPVIAFDFATLDQTAGTCFIEYQVTVEIGAMPGQTLTNNAVLDYDSTPVFVAGQTRRRMDSDTAEVNVIAPSLVKVAVDTSQPDTGMAQGDPGLLDLTIGETVTYRLTAVFPEGTSTNVILTDSLPAGAGGVIEAIGAVVTSLGGNISTSLPGTPLFQDNAIGDGLADTVLLDFGTVTNAPDGVEDANDRVVVEIVGRVVDVAANSDGAVLTNNAELSFNGGLLADSADVEVVEPAVSIAKAMSMQANGVVRVSLVLENSGTAPAYDLEVRDVFAEADWNLAGFTPVSVAAGFTLDLLPNTPAAGQQTLVFATDPGAATPDGTLPVGSSISAVFELPLVVLPPVPNPLPNTADLTGGDSLPGPDPTARDLPPDSDTAQIGVPDLVLDKTAALLIDADGSGDASPGDTLRYTLTLRNLGAGPASNIVIDDAPDANSSLVIGSVSPSAGTVTIGNTAGDNVVQVSIASLAAAGSVTISYDTTINNPLPDGVTELVNQALFDSTELPPGVSDERGPPGRYAPPVGPTTAPPDLVITKDDGGAITVPGGTVVYSLSYQNVGNQAATGVVISDTVPAHTAFNAGASTAGWSCAPDASPGSVCSLAIGTVAGGGAGGTVAFAVTVDDPLAAGVIEIANAASIADDGNNGPDPTPGNNGDGDTTPVNAAPDLTIAKDDGGATTVPGGTVVYTLVYRNVGNQTASGVEISETVPADTVFNPAASTAGWVCAPDNNPGSTCTFAIGDVAGGGAGGSIDFAVTVDDPLAAGVTEIANAATIADDGSNGPDPTPGNNGDGDTTPVTAAPDLAIGKEDGGVSTTPGGTVVYALAYQNIGNQAATGVVISDTVPANTVFNPAASTVGWVCVPDNNPGSNCGLAIGTVAGGGTGSVNFAVTVDDPLTAGVTEIANSALIADDGSNGPDPTPGNNADGDTTPVAAGPDLVITKDDGGAITVPGGTVVYSLSYQNVGNQAATGVVISDTVPAHSAFNAGASTAGWSCAPDASPGSVCSLAIGTVAGGGAGNTVAFAVTVDDPLAAGVIEIANAALIGDDGSNGPDPTPGNNGDGDTTPVNAAPDLTIAKDDGGATTVPGGTVVYTLVYRNVGNQTASGVEISETVPADTVFNPAASTAGWVCAPDNNPGSTCTFAIGDVAGGGAGGSIDFAVTVDDPLAAGVTEIANAATIADDGSNGPDPTPGNNGDGDTTPVDATPDLAIVKSDGGITAEPGDTVVFTLDYVNNGDQDATGVELTETVPPNSSFVAGASTPGWACTPDASAGSACVLAIGSLGGGASGSALFAIELDDPLPLDYRQIPNTAGIGDNGSNGPDPTPDDNDSSTLTPILLDPALELVKELSDAPDPIALGSVLEFTVTATNIGNMTLTNVEVSDSLITPTGGTTPCASVAPGESCTLIGTYVVAQPDVDAGEVLNTATADSDQTDPVETSLLTPVPQNPAIELVKEAELDDSNGNGLGDAGEAINYTITVTNRGDVTLTDVEVLDPLLGNLVCSPATPATLAPSEVIVCVGSLIIDVSDLNTGAIVNVATTSGTEPGGGVVGSGGNTVTPVNSPMAIPTLDWRGMMFLVLLVAVLGAGAARRRRWV
jgi:fimbrial isopeptide formation D2 family protein/uncharacterized repeat protein (TIGR01451 family)